MQNESIGKCPNPGLETIDHELVGELILIFSLFQINQLGNVEIICPSELTI
jgi:hypothetical protein